MLSVLVARLKLVSARQDTTNLGLMHAVHNYHWVQEVVQCTMAIQLHLATLEMLLVWAEFVSVLETTTDLETTHVVQNYHWV
ncbi:hypothetical protein DPMN_013081 [Dreissena polymorpha]|uniref:Uncharacterized protein n=1 Tax=Dreissena polymorpha TaxID=45954 RepID=A0A9D4S3C0_DREPO|nr:hypothetical protein DPMN_013081 [Dreissena polymorpha]